MSKKQILFSAVKPSGDLSIANYIGTIVDWSKLQADYNSIFSIADYHAITVFQDPLALKENILKLIKVYLAAGLDPEKSIIFQQSALCAHTELTWILSCYGATMSELERMIQYKEKRVKEGKNVSVGLFSYPILMAADILLYDTEVVPVGEDQAQHVELARIIGRRFNQLLKTETFVLPKAVIKKEGFRVKALLDPSKKMDKSDANKNNTIFLLDDPILAKQKIMKAVTDSGSDIYYNLEIKPALSNLLTIYAQLGNREIPRLEKDYKDKTYAQFKTDLAEVVAKFLSQFQDRYNQISDEQALAVLEQGAVKANKLTKAKLNQIKELIGLNL